MYDIVIVGAGTAGMSAAIYGLRAGKTVLLVEKKIYGGQIVNTPEVENYPGIAKMSGYEFATSLYNQAMGLGADIVYETVKKIINKADGKKVVTDKNSYEAKSVIIATGAKKRPLGLDNEEKLVGKGISYCAACDGMFFKNQKVAVAGGGSAALEDALFLSNICSKVYVIHRRENFRGENKLYEELKHRDNVEFVLNSNVSDIVGNQQLEKVIVKNTLDGSNTQLEVSGLFIAVGQMPDNDAFKDVVKLDDGGYIIAGEDCKTDTEGIFVAGDCRTKDVRQLTTAAADGAVAGLRAGDTSDEK